MIYKKIQFNFKGGTKGNQELKQKHFLSKNISFNISDNPHTVTHPFEV